MSLPCVGPAATPTLDTSLPLEPIQRPPYRGARHLMQLDQLRLAGKGFFGIEASIRKLAREMVIELEVSGDASSRTSRDRGFRTMHRVLRLHAEAPSARVKSAYVRCDHLYGVSAMGTGP